MAISTVLSAIATPTAESAETIRFCGVAVSVIDAGLIGEWVEQKGSGQQLVKLRERAEGNLEGEMLQAVSFYF